MRKHKRSGSLLATKISKFNFDGTSYQIREDKRGNSVKGCSLLPLTLRPRLFGAAGIATLVVGACIIGGFNSSVDNASAIVQATLTIPDSISADVNPYANNGFAESSIGQVEVSTNNQAGYTLSIKSKDGTELKNGDNVLNSITTNLTADQYQNGEYYNTWGFKSDVINNEANTSYVPAPSTNGIVLAQANTTSVMPEAFNLAIATKVSQDAVAGNYKNSFVLTATGNEARYNITFEIGKGTGGPIIKPGDEKPKISDYIGDDLEVQIPTDTPTSTEGKDFLGWCSKQPREDGSCTGVIVQPGGCFPLCKCDLDLTLYAMYGTKSSSEGGSGFNSGMNWTDCSSSGYDGPAKSFGGYCWMWQDYKTNVNWEAAKTSCPVGWHLPSKEEFEALIGTLGNGNLIYSLGWTGSDNFGFGMYWTSTEYDSTNAYYFYTANNAANIGGYGIKANASASGDGRTYHYVVRCVAG